MAARVEVPSMPWHLRGPRQATSGLLIAIGGFYWCRRGDEAGLGQPSTGPNRHLEGSLIAIGRFNQSISGDGWRRLG